MEVLRVCWADTYSGILPSSVIRTAIETWHSRNNLTRGIQDSRSYYVGHFDGGLLTGMACAAKIADDTLKVYQLYVLPSFQRSGIGSKLMNAVIRHFNDPGRVTLEVEEGNRKGLAFYRKYGFTFPQTSVMKVGDEEIKCLVGELVGSQKPSEP